MPRIEDYEDRLDNAIAEHTLAFATKPNKRDAFEYGERIGVIAGLRIAKQLIDQMQSEEDERGKIER